MAAAVVSEPSVAPRKTPCDQLNDWAERHRRGATTAGMIAEMATPLASLRLETLVLGTLELHDAGRVATVELPRRFFTESGAKESDTESLVNRARGIEGVAAAALLREGEGGEIRCSLRSKGVVDIRQVAARHGGGRPQECRRLPRGRDARGGEGRARPRNRGRGRRDRRGDDRLVNGPKNHEGPSGLLLVDKPEKLTSHDVVDEVRRLLGTRRIGHTGTLDPIATGLLVLCVGRAGRLQSFLTGFDKATGCEMKLGIGGTDTYDREGNAIASRAPTPIPRSERRGLDAASGIPGRAPAETRPRPRPKRIRGRVLRPRPGGASDAPPAGPSCVAFRK